MIRRLAGFTLVEVLVVIAIIGILAGIAYPSYSQYVRKGRRIDAQAAMVELAQQMERHYTTNNSYTGAVLDTGVTGRVFGYYTLTLSAQAAQTYTLKAVPTTSQSSEPCGTLTLSNTGAKTPSDCWN
jgi:type IV pilus assembly protein PilE